jgi:hypothetical protein
MERNTPPGGALMKHSSSSQGFTAKAVVKGATSNLNNPKLYFRKPYNGRIDEVCFKVQTTCF